VIVSPDGLKIYVACDSSGSTSGPTGGVTATPANPGSILEFTYAAAPAARKYVTAAQEQRLPPANTVNKTVDVYPNPASQFIVVYNYSMENTRTASLYNMNGTLVQQKQLQQSASRMDVSNLPAGLYILKITDAKRTNIRTEKIIINR
jgi:DNA-binding beta-propeller fold protein YncE